MQAHCLEPDSAPAEVGRVMDDDARRVWRDAHTFDATQCGEPALELGEEGVIAPALRHLETGTSRQAMNEVDQISGKHSARFFPFLLLPARPLPEFLAGFVTVSAPSCRAWGPMCD